VTDPKDELQELAEGIARLISDNRKFLSRLKDDDFEPDGDEDDGDDGADEEAPVG
jgi:hypothetical protein